ncbi:MAG: hypothetical protein FWG14_08575 [Peptococcaceae bacterium]|nr:hypothetical protein [Peptococcaceae bacterium]
MKKFSIAFLLLAILCTILFGTWATMRIVKDISFSFDCEAYLKRAADANTVEMAKEELAKAVDYAERNKLTEGVVSIFLKNPANDLGFWYNNMKAAYEELENLPEDTTPLEKTNVLMKLRESLTDRSNGDTAVICPDGISIYPNNVLYFWWALLSLVGAAAFWSLFGVSRHVSYSPLVAHGQT